MQDKKKFLLSILFILCVLISLSAVAAQDSSDMDADIQESSSDISDLAIGEVSDDPDKLGNMEDSPSATLGYSHQYNNSDESLESSSDSDRLGDDDISVYVPTTEDDVTQIEVTINDPVPIDIQVYIGDPPKTYTVSGNTFADIQNTINMASGHDIVIIPSGTYVGNGTPLVISSHITVRGEGNPTLDARNMSQILIVTDGYGDVTVSGINFINGNAPGSEEYGGAIVWGGARGKIINCNFINNHAGKFGGAILCKHYRCTIENCNFYYNTAPNCGAVYAANHNFTVSNCNFIGNSATDKVVGAVFLNGDDSVIKNSYFANNTAEFAGAVGINAAKGKILSTTFENNVAQKSCGAVVMLSDGSTIDGCHYINNSAKDGGALYASGNNIKISSCEFTGNRAREFGGALLLFGDNNKLSDSSFANNRAEQQSGGAGYIDGNNLTVINSDFENNHAQNGGALRLSGTNSKVLYSTFVNNSAYTAGAIQFWGNNIMVRDSNFTNNQAFRYGGAISAINLNGTVDNCNFVRNTATNGTSYGGAIMWSRDKGSTLYLKVNIDNSYFSNNIATQGSITFGNFGEDYNYDCTVNNCRFKNEYASIDVNSNNAHSLTFIISIHNDYSKNPIRGVGYNYTNEIYYYINNQIKTRELIYWNGETYYYYSDRVYHTTTSLIVEIYNNSTNELVSNDTFQTDSSGSYSYDYAILPDGTYRYRVYTLGSDESLPGLSEGTFEIHRAPTELSITVSNANYPETPVANITASSPGTYTIVLDGNTYSVSFSQDEIENGGGHASKMVDLGVLDASNDYVATVSYEINDQYLPASTQASFNVYQGSPEISIGGTEIYYGQDATITYAITGGVEIGSVVIKRGSQTLVDGTDYTLTISNDKIIIRGLAEGTYTVNVATAENTNYVSISNETTVIVKPLVDLVIGVSVNNQTPYYGDTVAYTITVSNNGPSAAADATVSFTVPSGMNVSSLDASYIGNGVWNISRIAAGSENAVVLTLYATANSKETLTASISATSKEDESNANDNGIEISISPVEISDISISGDIALGGTVLKVGDELTCTITVANRGPCDALNVRITDEFDSGLLRLIKATLDGVSIDYNGGYTIDSIANSSSCVIVLTFEVIDNGTIENALRAESSVLDPNESNNAAQCESVIAIPLVDLIISANVNNSTPHYGDTVTYTVTVTNNGPSAATDITVTASIPNGMNASSTDACYTGNGVWKISSLEASSENAIVLTLKATVESLEALTTEFTATSFETDSNGKNNNASVNLKAVPVLDLKISGATNVTTFENIGDKIAFTVTVVNDGPCDASGVSVNVALSEFVKFISTDGNFNSATNIWEIGNLNSKDSRSLVLILEVIENRDVKNSVSVNADELDLDEANNIHSIDVTSNIRADLSIDATVDNANPHYGDNITYTITVKNNGYSHATGVNVTVVLSPLVKVISTDGSFDSATNVWNINKLNLNESAILVLKLQVINAGTVENSASVNANEIDPDESNNYASCAVDAIALVDLSIDSTVDNANPYCGDIITYTITATNNGPCNATGVKVNVFLSPLVKVISADGSFDSATNVWNINKLNLNGNAILVLKLQAINAGTIENIASVNANENDTNETNNNCSIIATANKIPTVIVANNMVTTAIDVAVDGKKGQYFSVTLKDANSNPLAGQTIKITLNKITYTVQTKSNGVASVQVNIKKTGTYIAAISFAGSSKYLGSSAQASIKVNKQKPKLASSKKTFKAKAKTKKLTATLKTSKGKAIKGKKVTFTIKGKKYTVKTNKKGVATAKIKLTKKGKYVCKIKFAGDSTYSAITKKIKVALK